VMMMTKAIAKLIQTEQTHQIPSQLQMGRDLGMQLLDQALLAAITARTIDPDDAYAYASEKRPFQKYVTDTSMLPKVELTGTAAGPATAGSGTAGPAAANSAAPA
jgi:twitching motility protein PilT